MIADASRSRYNRIFAVLWRGQITFFTILGFFSRSASSLGILWDKDQTTRDFKIAGQ